MEKCNQMHLTQDIPLPYLDSHTQPRDRASACPGRFVDVHPNRWKVCVYVYIRMQDKEWLNYHDIVMTCCKPFLHLCIMNHWSITCDTCNLYILFCYSHPLPLQCLHRSIVNTTAAVVYACKTVDICGTCGLPLLYCIYHQQQTHYWHYMHNVFLSSQTLSLCICYWVLMQSVARCFTDELHTRVRAWMNAHVWLLCLLHALHVCALACLCVHISALILFSMCEYSCMWLNNF